MKDIAKTFNLALIIIGCIVFGLLVGYGLDEWIGSSPTFMIAGLLLGTMFAFMALYNMAKKK